MLPDICIYNVGLFSPWAMNCFSGGKGRIIPLIPCGPASALLLWARSHSRNWGLGLPNVRWEGAVLPSCDLQKRHEQPGLPTRILSALQGIVEGSPAVSSGCSSSCVDVMEHTVTEWAAPAWNFSDTSMLPRLLEGVQPAASALSGHNGLNPVLWGCISPECSWKPGKVYKCLEFHCQKACGSTTAPLKKPGGKSTSITLLAEMCS